MDIGWEEARGMTSEDAHARGGRQSLATGQSGLMRIASKQHEPDPNSATDYAMERYAAGNDEAFSELYDRIAPRLLAFLLRNTRNPAVAEDLLQQTMLRIHCARGRFISGAQAMPWVFSIARRLLIDGIRHSKYECSTDEVDGLETHRALEAIDCPADEAMHTRQVAQMVARELAQLPEAQRAAFELVRQEGLSHAEAAQILGTTVTAVKLRSHRTYVRLRTALNKLLETRDS
jgi:RNA polymerase sigma-70 factor, ECF subfamily